MYLNSCCLITTWSICISYILKLHYIKYIAMHIRSYHFTLLIKLCNTCTCTYVLICMMPLFRKHTVLLLLYSYVHSFLCKGSYRILYLCLYFLQLGSYSNMYKLSLSLKVYNYTDIIFDLKLISSVMYLHAL